MARIIRDDVDRFFEYGIDVNTRTVYVGSAETNDSDEESGVDHKMAEKAIKALHILDSLSPSGDKPITIIMNNPGGDEYHGLAIFDAIKACRNHVSIKVFGHAMSMGSIILQAADPGSRIMAPNSRMMIHFGTWGVHDHPKTVYKWAEEGKKFDKWMVDLYLKKIRQKHPKYQRKKVEDMCNFDHFLTAEQAVEIGLADKILETHDEEE